MTTFVSYDPDTYFSNRGGGEQPFVASSGLPVVPTYGLVGLNTSTISYPQYTVFPQSNVVNGVFVATLNYGEASGAAFMRIHPAHAAPGVTSFRINGATIADTSLVIGTEFFSGSDHLIFYQNTDPPFLTIPLTGADFNLYVTWQVSGGVISGTYAADDGLIASGTFNESCPNFVEGLVFDGIGFTSFGDVWVDPAANIDAPVTNPIANNTWIGPNPRPAVFFSLTDVSFPAVVPSGWSEVCHTVDQCNMSFNG